VSTPAEKEGVILSQKELQRIEAIKNAVQGRLTVDEAVELLQLSTRQVKRFCGDWILF
jgi:hypothetical protein